jgi:O-succinylbenzoate synthase
VSHRELPDLAELRSSARVISLPLRTRFRGLIEREVLVFEGPQGWAEFSPFVEYDDAEASAWLAAAIEYAYQPTPTLIRDSIEINATLPAVEAKDAARVLERYGKFSTVKIKVAETGQTINDDLARVFEVQRQFPTAKIRLDANGRYSVSDAIAVTGALLENGIRIDYLEQPVATLEDMTLLKQEFLKHGWQLKLAADELIRKSGDPEKAIESGSVDVVMLKAAPLGGVGRCLEIAATTKLPKVVSSALESSIGLAMGAHLAGALPELNYASGLGTATLLAGDVTDDPLLANDGSIEVRRVTASARKLELFKAEDHRYDWWLERLERCYRKLQHR